MALPTKYVPIWVCVFVCFLTAFFAFFFKKNYPEIARSQYIRRNMTVRSISVESRYCCEPECACSEVDGLILENCGTMTARAELLLPALCAAGNLSQCAPAGAAAGCNNGKNYGSCGSYGCEYSSCSGTRIQQQLCQLECDICYIVPYTVEFLDRHKTSWIVSFSPGFGQRIEDANSFMAAHPVNSTMLGYYKPSDPNTVLLAIVFHARKWGLLVLFAFPLFVSTVVLTQYIIAAFLGMYSPSLVNIDFRLNVAMWLGIIWPFIILLPILKVGYVKPAGVTALNVFIPLTAAFGWLPLVLYRLEKVGWTKRDSGMLAFCLLIVPVGAVLPCMLILVQSTSSAICIGVVVGAFLLVLTSCMVASWNQILDYRAYF